MALTPISLNKGVTVIGRMLARNGQVSLIDDVLTRPPCGNESTSPSPAGTAPTPTPRGQFFVEEGLALSPYDPGGPFALATSARSDVLREFDGGPGQIAIHGTDNLSGVPGTAVSHGCIRLRTHAIAWLAKRIGSGPTTIGR